MSLTQFARKVQDKKDAGELGPPSPPEPTADDLIRQVSEARDTLLAAADSDGLRTDVGRLYLEAQAGALGVFPSVVQRIEKAVSDARHPLTDDEREALHKDVVNSAESGAYNGSKRGAAGLVRSIDRKAATQLGMAVGGAFVVGCIVTLTVCYQAGVGRLSPEEMAGSAWRDVIAANPNPAGALKQARILTHQDGRQYYDCVPLWASLPVAPPRGR